LGSGSVLLGRDAFRNPCILILFPLFCILIRKRGRMIFLFFGKGESRLTVLCFKEFNYKKAPSEELSGIIARKQNTKRKSMRNAEIKEVLGEITII